MITILDVFTARGWDSCDHLIDDSPGEDMIGREYKSLKFALAAANKRGVQWPVTVKYSIDGEQYISYLKSEGANIVRVNQRS